MRISLACHLHGADHGGLHCHTRSGLLTRHSWKASLQVPRHPGRGALVGSPPPPPPFPLRLPPPLSPPPSTTAGDRKMARLVARISCGLYLVQLDVAHLLVSLPRGAPRFCVRCTDRGRQISFQLGTGCELAQLVRSVQNAPDRTLAPSYHHVRLHRPEEAMSSGCVTAVRLGRQKHRWRSGKRNKSLALNSDEVSIGTPSSSDSNGPGPSTAKRWSAHHNRCCEDPSVLR